MRRNIFIFLAAFWSVTSCLSVSCGNGKDTSQVTDDLKEEVAVSSSIPIQQVDTCHLRRGSLPREIMASGRLYLSRQAVMSFASGGILSQLKVKEGQQVYEGQLLALLDTASLTLQLEQAQNNLAKADYQRIKLSLLRSETFEKAGDSLPPNVAYAVDIESGFIEAQTQLKMAQLNLKQAEIRVPFSGRIAELKVHIGDRVSAGQPVMQLLDLGSAMAEIQLIEKELSLLKLGQQAELSVPALADQQFLATVETINPQIDSKGLSRLRLRIKNPNAQLYPGMQLDIRILLEGGKSQFLIPIQALTTRSGREVAFVIKDGRAKWKYIKTGLRNSQQVEIIEGLKPKDIIISSGQNHIAHDARVSIKN